MSNVVIHAEGLSKRYNLGDAKSVVTRTKGWVDRALGRRTKAAKQLKTTTFWALQDVSFEVEQGQKVGIIGRNGAGKSTLLKILSRIVKPTTGQAGVWGRVGSLLEVGTGFHHDLTARQNVYLNGAILGMDKSTIDRHFDQILAFAEIERFVDTPLKHFSSGMLSRLAFAVAAHLDADILLVDEVLSVGDASFQKKSLGKMNELTGGGRTVLFVSHDLASVTRLCERVIYLEDGRIVADGPAEEVVGEYLQNTTGEVAIKTWSEESAPGTADLRLDSVGVVGRDGRPSMLFPVDEPLEINVAYRTLNPNMRFRCCVILNTDGVCAFGALESREQLRSKPGTYESIVEVPPHLLAEKEYSLTISIFSSRGVKLHYVYEQDVLTFQVTDAHSGESARGDYAEGFAGVVRPKLVWRMQYRDAA